MRRHHRYAPWYLIPFQAVSLIFVKLILEDSHQKDIILLITVVIIIDIVFSVIWFTWVHLDTLILFIFWKVYKSFYIMINIYFSKFNSGFKSLFFNFFKMIIAIKYLHILTHVLYGLFSNILPVQRWNIIQYIIKLENVKKNVINYYYVILLLKHDYVWGQMNQ